MFERIFKEGFYLGGRRNIIISYPLKIDFNKKENKDSLNMEDILIQFFEIPFKFEDLFMINKKVNPVMFGKRFDLNNFINSDEDFFKYLAKEAWEHYPCTWSEQAGCFVPKEVCIKGTPQFREKDRVSSISEKDGNYFIVKGNIEFIALFKSMNIGSFKKNNDVENQRIRDAMEQSKSSQVVYVNMLYQKAF